MSHKQITFRAVAREKILRGAEALADAVRITFGGHPATVKHRFGFAA